MASAEETPLRARFSVSEPIIFQCRHGRSRRDGQKAEIIEVLVPKEKSAEVAYVIKFGDKTTLTVLEEELVLT